MATYKEFHGASLADRDTFWREEARLVDWQAPFTSVLDYSKPPFAKWALRSIRTSGNCNWKAGALRGRIATTPGYSINWNTATNTIFCSTDTLMCPSNIARGKH